MLDERSYFMWRNLNELDKIDPFNRAAPEVLATRLAIYHGLAKWELMQEIAKRLAEVQPDDKTQWMISLAYATRRADSIQPAKEILLHAEPKFPKEGIIKYNLACYSCQCFPANCLYGGRNRLHAAI